MWSFKKTSVATEGAVDLRGVGRVRCTSGRLGSTTRGF